jgi:hypothetical protein
MSKNTVAQTATGQAIVGPGIVNKVIISTHSSGVIRLVDSPNSTAGRVILDYTLVSGAQVIPVDLEYYEGVHVVLVSGTATISLAYSVTTV